MWRGDRNGSRRPRKGSGNQSGADLVGLFRSFEASKCGLGVRGATRGGRLGARARQTSRSEPECAVGSKMCQNDFKKGPRVKAGPIRPIEALKSGLSVRGRQTWCASGARPGKLAGARLNVARGAKSVKMASKRA
jgi:hypothetical protein